MISVNKKQCEAIGGSIATKNIKKEFLNRTFLTIKADDEHKARAFFHAVAICHHTYNLAFKDLNIYGWDVIEEVYVRLLHSSSALLDGAFYLNNANLTIEQSLKKAFLQTPDAATCTLDRLDERASLLIDLERWLKEQYNGSFVQLLNTINNSVTRFYEIMSGSVAFSDPLKKKSSFLMKLLNDAELMQLNNMESYMPIMDYHMQRVLLRTGCVEVDQQLRNILINRTPIKSDQELRDACISAMRIIAHHSGHPLPAMNDFFWPHGRSCCNEQPVCQHHKCEKKPCSLSTIIDIPEKHSCIFEKICFGKEQKNYRLLWQPVIQTHYY